MPVSMSGQADLIFVKPGLFLMVFASFFLPIGTLTSCTKRTKQDIEKVFIRDKEGRKESIFIGYLSDHSHPARNKLNKKNSANTYLSPVNFYVLKSLLLKKWRIRFAKA